jgi:hypothetical protein
MNRVIAVLVLLVACALAIAGCSTLGASAPSQIPSTPTSTSAASSTPPWFDPTWPSPPPRPPVPPVDPAIAPVSRSGASAAAKQALEACGVFEPFAPEVDGMGLIASANSAPDYARVTLTAPQLSMNASLPAWIVQFRGERPDPKAGQSWIDPTCIVIDGEPAFYATGPRRDLATGKILRGYYPAAKPPVKSLPPLQP